MGIPTGSGRAIRVWACCRSMGVLSEYGRAFGVWACFGSAGVLSEYGHALGVRACFLSRGVLWECGHAVGVWACYHCIEKRVKLIMECIEKWIMQRVIARRAVDQYGKISECSEKNKKSSEGTVMSSKRTVTMGGAGGFRCARCQVDCGCNAGRRNA